jgi:hypothetical protein
LHIIKERSEPTFETTRGSSYVDLTLTNVRLLGKVLDWTCWVQESSSGYKILTFNLGLTRQDTPLNNTHHVGFKYIIRNEDFGRFETALVSNMITTFSTAHTDEDLGKIDQEICDKLNENDDVGDLVGQVSSCITAACNTFRISKRKRYVFKKNTVPW